MGMPDTAVLYRRVARLITALAPITEAILAMSSYGWWLVMQRMPGIFKDDERHSDAQDLSEQNALAGQFVRRWRQFSHPRPIGLAGFAHRFRSMLTEVIHFFPSRLSLAT